MVLSTSKQIMMHNNNNNTAIHQKGSDFTTDKFKHRISSTCTAFLSSINLLAFYHECCFLIGATTHYLFSDRW